MIKCALISATPLKIESSNDKSYKIYHYKNFTEILDKKISFDIIFYYFNNSKETFLDIYHELGEYFDNLIFIVIYENIDIDLIKKGFKEGVYEFISKKEFKEKFSIIISRAIEHVKILKSKEKVYKYTTHKIYIKIPSDINLVNETVLQIITTGKVAGFIKNKKIENNIRLALTEGIVNAIVHGNNSDKNKNVEVNVNIDFYRMSISIIDMGKGFDLNVDEIDPLSSENLLKSHGRGIYLMKILMDDVRYKKEKNELILIKYKDNRKV